MVRGHDDVVARIDAAGLAVLVPVVVVVTRRRRRRLSGGRRLSARARLFYDVIVRRRRLLNLVGHRVQDAPGGDGALLGVVGRARHHLSLIRKLNPKLNCGRAAEWRRENVQSVKQHHTHTMTVSVADGGGGGGGWWLHTAAAVGSCSGGRSGLPTYDTDVKALLVGRLQGGKGRFEILSL